MKYKIGDKVRVKSLDWYEKNKNYEGDVCLRAFTDSSYNFTNTMSEWCGKVVTILSVDNKYYDIVEDSCEWYWTDEMFEDIEKTSGCTNHGNAAALIDTENGETELSISDGYELQLRDGKYYIIKKKPNYPTTFEECRKLVNVDRSLLMGSYNMVFYKDTMLSSLQQLIICYEAYCKVLGEELGLSDSWKPKCGEKHYVIHKLNDIVSLSTNMTTTPCLFSFPTEESQMSFYTNFKDLLYNCGDIIQ